MNATDLHSTTRSTCRTEEDYVLFALERLPPLERRALTLRMIDRAKRKTIAVELGLRKREVKALLVRAWTLHHDAYVRAIAVDAWHDARAMMDAYRFNISVCGPVVFEAMAEEATHPPIVFNTGPEGDARRLGYRSVTRFRKE